MIIMDANGMLYRMHHGMPNMTRRSDRFPTGALYGLSKAFLKIARMDDRRRVAVWDGPGTTFRHRLHPAYKAHREPPEYVTLQRKHAHRLADLFFHSVVAPDGFEADDAIASITTQVNGSEPVRIITNDKDMCQIINDRMDVKVVDPTLTMTTDEGAVKLRFSVPPMLFADCQALVGDSSDGYPGLPGIGQVKGAALVNENGPLEYIFANKNNYRGKVRAALEYESQAFTYREIARLRRDCYTVDMEATGRAPNWPAIRSFFEEFEFQSLMKDIPNE